MVRYFVMQINRLFLTQSKKGRGKEVKPFKDNGQQSLTRYAAGGHR
jgi:hypothetical protein